MTLIWSKLKIVIPYIYVIAKISHNVMLVAMASGLQCRGIDHNSATIGGGDQKAYASLHFFSFHLSNWYIRKIVIRVFR